MANARHARPPGSAGGRSLLDELGELYPELPAHVISDALDRAHLAAGALTAGTGFTCTQLRTLARDRLDLARERAAAAHRRARPASAAPVAVADADVPASSAGDDKGAPVPCTHCRGPVPAARFTARSGARRLRCATCPHCRRRVTTRSPAAGGGSPGGGPTGQPRARTT